MIKENNLPRIAQNPKEIADCFAVLSQLRPHVMLEEFVLLIQDMAKEGYQLAYIEEEGVCVAVAGFRIYTNLFLGKNLYIDDLVTAEDKRSKGYGKTMIDWLIGSAREHECKAIHLDSGTNRHKAHKFYLNQGFDIVSYHFSQSL